MVLFAAFILSFFRRDAVWVANIGPAVLEGLTSVILFTDGVEVLLNYIDLAFVILLRDARVIEDDYTELVERVSNLPAL